MAYTKTNWSNGETALSDVNMNHIETGIKDAHDRIDEADELIEAIKTIGGEFILSLYPVGSILMNTTGTNPGTYLGGTWEAWGSGRVPVGVNTSDTSFDTSEKTGGEKTHTLTPAETAMKAHHHTHSHTHGLPSHSHNANGYKFIATDAQGSDASSDRYDGSLSGSGWRVPRVNDSYSISYQGDTSSWSGSTSSISSTNTSDTTAANGTAHNNLQPYITCYMFKRTA